MRPVYGARYPPLGPESVPASSPSKNGDGKVALEEAAKFRDFEAR